MEVPYDVPTIEIPLHRIKDSAIYYRLMEKQYAEKNDEYWEHWSAGHARAFEWILEEYGNR